ncbi:MAG: HAMP domain-containing protein [Deltaproteobacteria bacterium]|nr:MAG: HAMP domain-containing protein [Deltaproteobacteria bacterium]
MKRLLRRTRLALWRHSLRIRLVGIMLFIAACLISILIAFYYQTEKGFYNEFARQNEVLSKAVQVALEKTAGRAPEDFTNLDNYLRQLDIRGVQEISVISSGGRIVASTNDDNVGKWITEWRKQLITNARRGETVTEDEQFYNVILPVGPDAKPLGFIHLTLSTEKFSIFLRLSLIRRVLAALAVLGLATVVAVVLAGRYSRPIEQMAEAASKVAAGDFDQTLPVSRRDEIGQLARSFDHMIARLREDRELRQRVRTAEHMATVGQFARSIAHEIKNPLNFISLSVDHMRDAYRPVDADKAARYESLIDNIKGEVARVARFAESFLEYGRPFELHCRRCSLTALVDEVLELVAARAAAGHVEIHRNIAELPELLVDPEFIKTCLYNIVVNAFEAMPAGGTLTVRGLVENGMVTLAFADTGEGLSAMDLDKVFTPLFSTKQGGAGLGLALTKRIIEDHGGKVGFASTRGVGSEVSLYLPLEGAA